MNAFEIYLLSPEDAPVSPERLLEAFRAEGWFRQLRADPSRFVYRNEDTGVFFQVLAPPLHRGEEEAGSVAEAAAGESAGRESASQEGPGAAGVARDSEGEGSSAAPQEGEEREADEDSIDIEVAPVAFTLPVVCPSFFGREAVAVAERVAAASGLELGAGDSAATPSDILSGWEEANRKAAAQCRRPESSTLLAVWTREASEEWWRYGAGLGQLERELAPAGIHVPRLQAAVHEGRVKSLCAWDEGTPAVFPRADLFLVRRERERKGLLFTRRVTEQGLVSGERLWDILASFGELRDLPARLLIFREARRPPQQVAAALEVLPLEPVEGAKRTELLGVVDFEVAGSDEGEGA